MSDKKVIVVEPVPVYYGDALAESEFAPPADADVGSIYVMPGTLPVKIFELNAERQWVQVG